MNTLKLEQLHIGKIIKKIASVKKISSKEIADIINRSQQNANKIFWHDDMVIEDIIRISYLLKFNILFFIINEFLPHLITEDTYCAKDTLLLKIDMKSRTVIYNDFESNINYLKNIHIGNHIKKVAIENKWKNKDVAKLLCCSISDVSYLYQCKSLKIKKLLQISAAFQFNFFSVDYLNYISIGNSLNFIDDCVLLVNRKKIQIINLADNKCLLNYQLDNAKIS